MSREDGTLHGDILALARSAPQRPAVYAEHGVVTYGELDTRSDALARRLAERGAGPGVCVGVCVERTPDLLVALLAVLRAGACYLPLDPQYPDERLRFVTSDSGTRLVVTTTASRGRCPAGVARVVLDGDTVTAEPGPAPARTVPGDSAYVIYTSGSTGRPKGVPIRHASCAAILDEMDRIFAGCDLGGVVAASSVSFDMSVLEIFHPLGRGGAVVLVESAVHLPDSPHLDRVTQVNAIPSVMAALLDGERLPPRLSTVVLGGEAVRRRIVDRLYAVPGVERVYNGYGPSEGTVFCAFKLVERDGVEDPTIGPPASFARVAILDDAMRPLPPGEVGEIYLGGAGLAWGYLDRPGTTAQRFVPDPSRPGERMYRTGDLARFTPEGEIAFVGRADQQVKVRGYRIELQEVEANLARCPEVREAVVTARPAGDTLRLVAYVVPAPDAGPVPDGPVRDLGRGERIAASLRAEVPDHMVPEVVVFLPELPLAPNDKVDRAALPEPPEVPDGPAGAGSPGGPPGPHGHGGRPVSTPTETTLAELWGSLLDRDPAAIGAHDTFYELGGNSLLLVRLARSMSSRFGRRVAIADLFRFRDIEALGRWLDEAGDEPSPQVERARRRAGTRRAAAGARRARPRTRPEAVDTAEPAETVAEEHS